MNWLIMSIFLSGHISIEYAHASRRALTLTMELRLLHIIESTKDTTSLVIVVLKQIQSLRSKRKPCPSRENDLLTCVYIVPGKLFSTRQDLY